MKDMELKSFCSKLPKLELHAHLNGCIRQATLQSLTSSVPPLNHTRRSLADCFTLFSIIHSISTDLNHVRRITREAIEDFEKDNVIYIELRTTPKHRPEKAMTKALYMEAVMKGHIDYVMSHPDSVIIVKWILSVDRRENEMEAMETVLLAIRLKSEGVVGIDLSGDPKLGTFDRWRKPMMVAREAGLKLTFHAGELENDPETQRLVQFHPDRLGHLCFVDGDLKQSVLDLRIPLEICLSSNLVTESVNSLNEHHLIDYHTNEHPVAICTDDPSIFDTTSSHEYELAADVLGLDQRGIFTLAESVIDQAFCDEQTKMKLRSMFNDFNRKWLHA